MKKIIITITTAVMLIATFSSFAGIKTNPLKDFNSNRIVATYVEAITLGNYDFNTYLFAEDFEYQNTANSSKFNKKQYTKFLKQNKGLKYNCETTYAVLDETGNSCVAKATMKFDTFSRVDYITLTRDKDSWKISKVVTTYP